jgi:hypothetical protein
MKDEIKKHGRKRRSAAKAREVVPFKKAPSSHEVLTGIGEALKQYFEAPRELPHSIFALVVQITGSEDTLQRRRINAVGRGKKGAGDCESESLTPARLRAQILR